MASIMNRAFGISQHSANGFEVVTDAAYYSVMDRKGREGREEEGEGKGFFFCGLSIKGYLKSKACFL